MESSNVSIPTQKAYWFVDYLKFLERWKDKPRQKKMKKKSKKGPMRSISDFIYTEFD